MLVRSIFAIAIFFAVNVSAHTLIVENKVKFDIDVVSQYDDMAKGLMYVKEIPENYGMLFDFGGRTSGQIRMWMKNTYIPLDIVFIGCDFQIVDVYENAQPLSLKLIRSSKDFCYVLEIKGGNVKKYRLKLNDKTFLKE